jgi:hypothetical protein
MKTTILVVDDEAEIREWVKLVLGDAQYVFTEAQDLASLRRSLGGPAPGSFRASPLTRKRSGRWSRWRWRASLRPSPGEPNVKRET